MKENLLFVDINWSFKEVKLFELFWRSLVLTAREKPPSFDLMIITNYRFKEEILKIMRSNQIDLEVIFVMVPQDYSYERASLRHLDLFQYEQATQYKRALHVRPETLVMRTLDKLFEKKTDPNMIYSYCEDNPYDHNAPWYGLQNYSQEDLVFFRTNYIKVWTSSIYMMVPNKQMKHHFSKVKELADMYINKGVYNDTCYMNFYFNMQKMSDTMLLKKLLESRNIKTNVEGKPTVFDTSIDIKVVLINFCGLSYFEEKQLRMKRYLKFLEDMRPCIKNHKSRKASKD